MFNILHYFWEDFIFIKKNNPNKILIFRKLIFYLLIFITKKYVIIIFLLFLIMKWNQKFLILKFKI